MAMAAVAVSDLHLGARHSTLNVGNIPYEGDPSVPHGAAARDLLVRQLRGLAGGSPIPRLILLGDVIDLSHGTFPAAVEQFDSLVRDVLAGVDVEEFVFVPGNHDRHWWHLQCEHDGLIEPLKTGRAPADHNVFRRTTSTAGRIDVPVITGPLDSLGATGFRVAYPDYEFDAGGHRVRCHHGHLFQDLYTMNTHVLENALVDLRGKAKRRDPHQSPTATQQQLLSAAEDEFAAALEHTLGGVQRITNIEAYERLNAPLINLDWLLLGQTSLLDHGAMGSRVMRFLATAPTAKPGDATRLRRAARGLAQVVGLALLDRLTPVKKKPWLHSYSNNVTKTFLDSVVKTVTDAITKPSGQPPDDQGTSLVRGEALADQARGIEEYVSRFAVTPPDVMIVGHTHVAGQGTVGTMNVFNTGSWVSSARFPTPQWFLCAVDDGGAVQFGPAA